MGGWVAAIVFVSKARVSNTEYIFQSQILFQAIYQLHLCSPSILVQVLGQDQSKRNLEIRLLRLLSVSQVGEPFVKV